MPTLEKKFDALKSENVPGQQTEKNVETLHSMMIGNKLDGVPIDFSHGDVDAFAPTPGSEITWKKGFDKGSHQAYTKYRGSGKIIQGLADRLGDFTNRFISANDELIITPGSQGALFLAIGSTVVSGAKVAVVEPDYYANRKLVKFFGGEVVPIPLVYADDNNERGINLDVLEEAFKNGTKVLIFSTPNNPTGLVYSNDKITKIAALTAKYDVTVIVDELYCRMLYSGEHYTHLRSIDIQPKNIITIMGPSKTESLSGFRLGVAFGTAKLIENMERLQAIVSLRASGYNQAVLDTWFNEPAGWLDDRILKHEAIRNDLLKIFRDSGLHTATPQAGCYLFPKLPELTVDLHDFIRLLRYQANIIVAPGTEFDPACNDRIRLNFSQNHALTIDAANRIVKMVKIYSK